MRDVTPGTVIRTCAKVLEQLIELIADCNEVHWFCHRCDDIVVKVISNLGKSNLGK